MDIQSTSRTVPKTKRWVIGSFTDTNEFSILPTNWLIRTSSPDGWTIIYCKWPSPPTSVTSYIMNIATNFKKLWNHKFVLSSDFSSLTSSSNEVDELKNKKLCSQAQKSNFHKDSDSSESEEEVYNILELQGVEMNTDKILSTANSNQQMNISQISSIQTNRILEVPQIVEDYNFNQYDMPYPYALNNSLLETTDSQVSDKQMHNSLKKCMDPQHTDLLEKLNQGIIENNFMLKRLLAKIEIMETNQKVNSTEGDMYLDPEFNAQFPIQNSDGYKLVERKKKDLVKVTDRHFKRLLQKEVKTNLINLISTSNFEQSSSQCLQNIQFNVTHNCLNSLLNILRTEGLNVLKDGRTLMKTPSKHTIIQMNNGSYVHFGIEQMVYPILHKHKDELTNINNLKFGINVDGLPLAKSSKSQFWPILMCIVNVKIIFKHVIPIGIFHGFEKSSSVDEFLSFFFMDVLNMLENVKGEKDIRLLDESKNDINKNILNLRSYVPSEFARLPRSMDDIDHWKATELMTFILYYGHIVLKGKLQNRFYQHFLLLFSTIRLVVNPETCILYNEKARILLEKFINDYAILYGSEFITYNVHNLINLPYFVQKHGPLDSFSAFSEIEDDYTLFDSDDTDADSDFCIENMESDSDENTDKTTSNVRHRSPFLSGLLYLAGYLRSNHLNLHDLWRTDGFSPEYFRAVMSEKRFSLLLRAVRFDDIETRNVRRAIDKLAPIRTVFDDFVRRCKENYTVGENCTIDEMLDGSGTLRKNKREIPPIFLETKKREVNSTLFGYGKDLLFTFCTPNKNKNVIMISIMHDEAMIDQESGDQKKPEVITYYNSTKGGVDVVDEMKGEYSVARISCRWPLNVFH
ncbi:hypothetical protein AGLY_017387 [Aphis glycines]|uniref:PiggyBac transposable element-derived protein domain-containing protein n=1 Tax=Aphis glycines TaxID=307491 RepID=A0A6G0SVT6_APHGL|nr:hypothetical protein AGLY_017387 [Aphis glycines]